MKCNFTFFYGFVQNQPWSSINRRWPVIAWLLYEVACCDVNVCASSCLVMYMHATLFWCSVMHPHYGSYVIYCTDLTLVPMLYLSVSFHFQQPPTTHTHNPERSGCSLDRHLISKLTVYNDRRNVTSDMLAILAQQLDMVEWGTQHCTRPWLYIRFRKNT